MGNYGSGLCFGYLEWCLSIELYHSHFFKNFIYPTEIFNLNKLMSDNMSKPRRESANKPNDSIDESKNVSELNETLTQLKNDIADMQSRYQELDNNMRSQNEKISELKELEGKTASPEKLVDVLNLQNKYNDLYNSVKMLNEKFTSPSSANIMGKTESSQNIDETTELLKSLKKDIGSFVTYGKLFLGIGVAALLLYIIITIITLAALLKPAVG
jgi:prefoldin subunit 5